MLSSSSVFVDGVGFDGIALPVYTAEHWELFHYRLEGSSVPMSIVLNAKNSAGALIPNNEPCEMYLAPGDSVYGKISTSGFTFHYTTSMVWPKDISEKGIRTMASRSDQITLVSGEARTIVESKDEWYEITTIANAGIYRIGIGGNTNGNFAQPVAGRQWRCIAGPGDIVSVIGGGAVSVGITVTQLPPVDRLVRKLIEKMG